MWDITRQSIVKTFTRTSYGYCCCAFVGRNQDYLACADIFDLALWNRDTGKLVRKNKGHSKKLIGVAQNPRKRNEFLTYAYDGTFIVWSDEDSSKKRHSVGPNEPVDGKRQATEREEDPLKMLHRKIRASWAFCSTDHA
jgi:WD40 repeat protein